MAEPMSLETWLKLTDAGTFAIRDGKLKAIDSALGQYQKSKSAADMERLRSALMAWIMDKGTAWQRDPRNKYSAFSDLYAQVMGTLPQKSGAGMVALSHVQDEERAMIDTLFRGKKLVWRDGFFAKLANQKWGVTLNTPSAAHSTYQLATSGSTSSASQTADKIIDAIVPGAIRSEVMTEAAKVIPEFMKELVAAVTPFLGVITAAGSTVWNVKGAIQNEYRKEKTEQHLANSLSVQTPEQAIRAMIRIIERDRNADVFSASVSFGEFVGKLAGTLADGGTATNAAIGLAAGLAKLGNILRIIVRDVLEKNDANEMMMKGPTPKAFETCPILGAYYVCCVPTSVLVNQIFERWWQGGWQGDVEHSVTNHVEPMREQARRLIGSSRFVIRELLHYPGVLTPNKKALEEMASRVGKTGMEGRGPAA